MLNSVIRLNLGSLFFKLRCLTVSDVKSDSRNAVT